MMAYALREAIQEDFEFEASLSYLARPRLKTETQGYCENQGSVRER